MCLVMNMCLFLFAGYPFNTCANTGSKGPTQYQCDRYYDKEDLKVTVEREGALAGVQVWTVPETNLYR